MHTPGAKPSKRVNTSTARLCFFAKHCRTIAQGARSRFRTIVAHSGMSTQSQQQGTIPVGKIHLDPNIPRRGSLGKGDTSAVLCWAHVAQTWQCAGMGTMVGSTNGPNPVPAA